MPTEGYRRYLKLFKNIGNPGIYFRSKFVKPSGPLAFVTRPNPIRIQVPKKLFLVFKEIFMSDVYDIDELIARLPPKPVVVDIGANAGYFDLILLSKISDAKIFAYEPMPANAKLLGDTIKENNLETSITLFQKAVTGKPQGNLTLYVEDAADSTVVASVFSDFNQSNEQKVSVPCVSLTEIIEGNQLTSIDILKVDCEGSEFDIFYNTSPELIKRASIIAVEVHDMDKDKANIDYFNNFLKSIGYQTTHTQINGFCHALTATKTSGAG